MSYYKRSEKEPRRARKSAGKSWGDNAPLTNPQKGKLSMYAREAWDALDRAGLVDGEDFDDWKHTQTEIACGVNSFRLATNKQFRSIKGRFLRLAGKEAEAKKTLSTTGRVAGSKEQHDTHENPDSKFWGMVLENIKGDAELRLDLRMYYQVVEEGGEERKVFDSKIGANSDWEK